MTDKTRKELVKNIKSLSKFLLENNKNKLDWEEIINKFIRKLEDE